MALYIMKYKEGLEKILKMKMFEVELDKNMHGRKVDFFTVLEDDRELYMELQLSKADALHKNQILKIIADSELNNFVLIWAALDFTPEILSQVEQVINKLHKNILFYALNINRDIIGYLQKLNCMFINKIMDNLDIIKNAGNCFTIREMHYRINDEGNVKPVKKKEEVLNLDNKEHVVKLILKELRREISFYPSIYRDKQMSNNVMVLGSGCSDVNYQIGINRNNNLYVILKFGLTQGELFESFLQQREEINNQFDYFIEFDKRNRTIGTFLYCDRNKEEVRIKQLVRMVNKYILYFSPLLYNR